MSDDFHSAVTSLEASNARLVDTTRSILASKVSTHNSYDSTADGLAGTSLGNYFTVAVASGLTIYKHVTESGVSVAEEVLSFPTKADYDAVIAGIEKRVIYVDSIADMLAMDTSGLVDGQQVSVIGVGVWYWDATSVETTNDGAVLGAAAEGRFKLVPQNNETTSAQWRILDASLTDEDRSQRIQTMWDWCVANDVKAVMLPGDYYVAAHPDRPNSRAVIIPTSGFCGHFETGARLIHTSFTEDGTQTTRCVLSFGTQDHMRENITITGTITVDGGGDTVTWYNEHCHCVDFINCRNISVENIVSYNAMGDCVRLSGWFNSNSGADEFSRNIRIADIDAGKARRKSLVLESVKDGWIGRAVLDNGHDHCLDCEPLSWSATDLLPVTFRIDYLYCKSGTDFSAGSTPQNARNYKVDIGRWVIELNPECNREAIWADAIGITAGSLFIDASKAPNVLNIIQAKHAFRLDVAGNIEILLPEGYTGTAVDFTTPNGPTGVPRLTANRLEVTGHSVIHISNNTGAIYLQELIIRCLLKDGFKPLQDTPHIYNVATAESEPNVFKVGVIRVVNSRAKSVVDSRSIKSAVGQHLLIDRIITDDTTTDTPLGAVMSARAIAYNQRQHLNVIGGINHLGQAPASLFVNENGARRVYCLRGGEGSPSEFYYETTSSPSELPAKAGSTCRISGGKLYFKAMDADANGDETAGWVELATVV